MFHWSKKVVKSVTFNPDVADESLLGVVESHLEQMQGTSFSDLCKHALWQLLCVPKTGKSAPKTAAMVSIEEKIDQLQHQVTDLEKRFFGGESKRLENMEYHILQLTQQMTYLFTILNEGKVVESLVISRSEPTDPQDSEQPHEEVDPVISRLSQFLDDF